MGRWTKRLTYVILLLLWLLLISIPFFAFTLAARGQFEIGDASGSYVRIFVLQEKDAEGIGVELAQPSSDNPSCRQTTVRYLMWAGEGEDVTFCQCLNAAGEAESATPGRCVAPDLYNPP